MFKKIKLFRTSSTKRREEESILKRRRMIQHALLSSYRLVPGVAGGRGCISFECFSKPRFFLCHRDNNLIIERYKDSEDYKSEATFVILENMWFQDFFAFECFTNPGWFIRRNSSGLSLQRYDGSREFKESASFKLSRKKCLCELAHITICGYCDTNIGQYAFTDCAPQLLSNFSRSCNETPVVKGARVWVRMNNMCFTRGVVTKDGHELHVVTTKGKLIRCPRNKPEFLAVDKIPNAHDIRPGCRVAAQWHDRSEPFYLATVQGRLGHNKYLMLFDDDDEGYCDLKNIRVLLWTGSESEESVAAPAWSSLEDIPRLSSGMLLHNQNHNNNNYSSKSDKNAPKKAINTYRKISVSDQHLELRNDLEIVPNFLQLSSASSYREGSSSNRSDINGSGFTQSGVRLGSRRMSLGTVLERRERKNGFAGIFKYQRR